MQKNRHIRSLATLTLLTVSSFGCGLKQGELASHRVLSPHAGEIVQDSGVWFAMVGNTRESIPLLDSVGERVINSTASAQITSDLIWRSHQGEFDFVVHLGDMVRRSTNGEWSTFTRRYRDLLDGSTLPEIEGRRIPVVPVAGEGEFAGDPHLSAFGSVFPTAGADIGFNRVASWGYFDVETAGSVWRFLTLDSNKNQLGSRWDEQLRWLPEALHGDYDSMIILTHDSRVTLAVDGESNPEEALSELLEIVDYQSGVFKLKAVMSAGAFTSEVFLPDGRLGVAYINAGASGAVAESINRWGDGIAAGFGQIQLEPMFDIALQAEFDTRGEEAGWDESVYDRSRGEGAWDGFTASYISEYLPTFGYWLVNLEGSAMTATFQILGTNGQIAPLNYSLVCDVDGCVGQANSL
jgi:hypothetical protein